MSDFTETTIRDNIAPASTTEMQQTPLRDCVGRALQNYFTQLEGQAPSNVYEMVLAEVEAPLLESVMQYTRGNQSKAAILLGLSRGTLRKKLKIYDLLD